jgi:hypothetical protein
LEHKPLISWSKQAGAAFASYPAEGHHDRADWQALLFGLILMALCFVQ